MIKFLEDNSIILVLLLVVLFTTLALSLVYTFRPTMDDIEWREMTHTVLAGDTLWSIASDYCPDSVDRREWIAEVKVLNAMETSTIHPGQKLTVLLPVG